MAGRNRWEPREGAEGNSEDRETLSKDGREEAVNLSRIGDKVRPIAPADVGAAARPPSPEAVGQFLLQSKLPLLWGEILPTASCRGPLAFASRIVVDNGILDARAARGRPLPTAQWRPGWR